MTDIVARAEAEKALEKAVGFRIDVERELICGDVVSSTFAFAEKHGVAGRALAKLWNAALSVMEENERLKLQVDAFEAWKKQELVPRAELLDRAEAAEAKLAGEKWEGKGK